ncbi:translation initiation factor IF-2-like [Mesocricetus auratus]|uniref:Translation initiation factor IF-2-like n=1 Tax=Mesocricetus auratus TaxID=10036 RepID=A0ABM2W3L9_MESAU|nr:translation initiation factor IF-2-like [Mesocricetus auratus]
MVQLGMLMFSNSRLEPQDVRGLGAPLTALSWWNPRWPCRARRDHVSVLNQNAVVPTPLSGRLEPAGDAHPGSGQQASGRASGHKPNARCRPQRGGLKPPVLGPRASDAGKCPHPGNPRRTAAAAAAAAATRSGRQNGGGGDGLVLRGEPGPRDPASGRAGRPQPPRRVSPPCPIPNPERPQGARARAAAAPALGPAAAVREPRCPRQVSYIDCKGFEHSWDHPLSLLLRRNL